MSIDIEYAIKKDIRNNPVVREVDVEQKREFRRTLGLTALMVALLLFSAVQHLQVVSIGYKIQALEQARAAEESANRQLRLEVESLRAPQRIEQIAVDKLNMVAPSAKDTLIIERAKPVSPDKAVVALGPATPSVR
jgi:cell division protein FtsL